MAEFVSPNEVVIYESLVIGASVIGFFVRPILYYRRPHAIDATSDVTGVLLLAAVSLLGENGKDVRGWLAARALPIRWAAMLAGTIAVLLLGVWGSGFSEASFIYFNF